MHKLALNLACIRSMMPAIEFLDGSRRSQLTQACVGLCFFAWVLLAAAFVNTGINNALAPTGSHDFQWTPAKEVVDGIDPYRDFITWQEQGNESVPPHFLNQSPSYPASTYVLLSPVAHFEWETAKVIWVISNLIFIFLLLAGMQKVFPVARPIVLAILVLAFLSASPLRTSLGAGQHNLISLAAFIWAYYFAHNGKNKSLSGLLLSIAWIKYSLTFPLTLIFLRRGSIKPVLIAAGIHAVLTCIAAWRTGLWPHEFFFSSVHVVLMGEGKGFLNLIALCMHMNLPLPVPLALIGIATVAVTYTLNRNSDANPLLVMAFLGLFSCAVFYHHGYDFIVLLLCAWALATGLLQGAVRISTIGLLAIAWAGHWLTKELSSLLGPYPEILANTLMVMVFYYTVFLFARALHKPREKLEPAAAISF